MGKVAYLIASACLAPLALLSADSAVAAARSDGEARSNNEECPDKKAAIEQRPAAKQPAAPRAKPKHRRFILM